MTPTTTIMTPLLRFITIDKFSEATGYTAEACRAKIKRGDWLEGDVFTKAPDGRILINTEGYERWVTQGSKIPVG